MHQYCTVFDSKKYNRPHCSHPFINETAKVPRRVFFSSKSMSQSSSSWYLEKKERYMGVHEDEICMRVWHAAVEYDGNVNNHGDMDGRGANTVFHVESHQDR